MAQLSTGSKYTHPSPLFLFFFLCVRLLKLLFILFMNFLSPLGEDNGRKTSSSSTDRLDCLRALVVPLERLLALSSSVTVSFVSFSSTLSPNETFFGVVLVGEVKGRGGLFGILVKLEHSILISFKSLVGGSLSTGLAGVSSSLVGMSSSLVGVSSSLVGVVLLNEVEETVRVSINFTGAILGGGFFLASLASSMRACGGGGKGRFGRGGGLNVGGGGRGEAFFSSSGFSTSLLEFSSTSLLSSVSASVEFKLFSLSGDVSWDGETVFVGVVLGGGFSNGVRFVGIVLGGGFSNGVRSEAWSYSDDGLLLSDWLFAVFLSSIDFECENELDDCLDSGCNVGGRGGLRIGLLCLSVCNASLLPLFLSLIILVLLVSGTDIVFDLTNGPAGICGLELESNVA